MPKTWIVFDTPYIAWRSFYSKGLREAIPSIVATMAELNDIGEHLDSPHRVFAFDQKPYLRKQISQAYKASREQRGENLEDDDDLLKFRLYMDRLYADYLGELGFQNSYSIRGYEADDIIACVVNGLPRDDQAIIVSADQDLYQLLSPRVSLFIPSKKEIWTTKRFQAFTGIHPSQWPEAKALAGCSTDDIAGISGVAIPTACKYLRGDEIPVKKKDAIEQFIATETYQCNLRLVRLPFEGMKPIEPVPDDFPYSPQRFRELCRKLTGRNSEAKDWRREDGDGSRQGVDI